MTEIVTPRKFLDLMRSKIRLFSLLPTLVFFVVALPTAWVSVWLIYTYSLDQELEKYKYWLDKPVRTIVLARDVNIVGEKTLDTILDMTNIYTLSIIDSTGYAWIPNKTTDRPVPIHSENYRFEVKSTRNDFLTSPDFEANRLKSSQQVTLATVSLVVDTTALNLLYAKSVVGVLGVTFVLGLITFLLSNRIMRSLKAVTEQTFVSIVGFASGQIQYLAPDPKDSPELREAKVIINYVGRIFENFEEENRAALDRAIAMRDQAFLARSSLENQKDILDKHSVRVLKDIHPKVSEALTLLNSLEFHLASNPLLKKSVRCLIDQLSPIPPLCHALSTLGQASAGNRSRQFETEVFIGDVLSDVYDAARTHSIQPIIDLPKGVKLQTVTLDYLAFLRAVSQLFGMLEGGKVTSVGITFTATNPFEITIHSDLRTPLNLQAVAELMGLSMRLNAIGINQISTHDESILSLTWQLPLKNKAPQSLTSPSHFKVLILDTQFESHPALTASLDAQGIEYRIIDSYQTALHDTTMERFDAVLIEPTAQGLNGFDLAKLLVSRNLVSSSGLPTLLIGLVAVRTQAIDEKAEAAGITFVLERKSNLANLHSILAASAELSTADRTTS